MTFLVFDTEENANTAIAQVHDAYDCPVLKNNGYKMTIWDTVTKSNAENKWGFFVPWDEIAKAAINVPYQEVQNIPSDWRPADENKE